MAAAELELKSPLSPFVQRGNFLGRTLTPFEKEGKGDFQAE
jgi:hypothetical protein